MKVKLQFENAGTAYFGEIVEIPEAVVNSLINGFPLTVTSFEHPDGPFATGRDVDRKYALKAFEPKAKGDHNGLVFGVPTLTLVPAKYLSLS